MELHHGDCLEILPRLKSQSVDLCLTDPPYGTTACKWDTVIPFEPMWAELKRVCKEDAAICLFGSEPFSSALRMSNVKMFKYDWIWQKEKGLGFLNAKKMPLRDSENISVFCKKSTKYFPQMRTGKPYKATNKPHKQKGTNRDYGSVETINNGVRYPLTTLRFDRVRRTVHPTQKPIELLEYLIKTYTKEGDTVLDFTAGSGSTGVACANLGRKFIGIEKDEKYFQIAKERLKQS